MKSLEVMARALRVARLEGLTRRYAARGPGFIAVYHDVSRDALKAHLHALSKDFEIVSLSELASRLSEGRSTARLMAVTYDDGLRPVVESAAALAHDHGWPMTFYLPTRFIDSQKPPWYVELRPLIESTPRSQVQLDGALMRLDSRVGRERTIQSITRRLMSMPTVEEVETYMDRLRSSLYESRDSMPDMTLDETVSWSQVKELSRREELTFGAHTVNHLPLARLDPKAIEWEFQTSKERLESVTNRPADHFCYPFGGLEDIGEAATELARSMFDSAVTMIRGRCRPESDLALLPRIPFWSGDRPDVVRLRTALTR